MLAAAIAIAGMFTDHIELHAPGIDVVYMQCSTYYLVDDQLNGQCNQAIPYHGSWNWVPSNTPITVEIALNNVIVYYNNYCYLVSPTYIVECDDTIFADGFE